MSTTTKGPFWRGLSLWMASAHTSLPVPVSPWMSTSDAPGASRSSRVNISRIFRLRPTSPPKLSLNERWSVCHEQRTAADSAVFTVVT
jgi:hypothetical protein